MEKQRIIFVTNKNYSFIEIDENYEIIQSSINEVYKYYNSLSYGHTISIDTETNGLDPYINSILLLILKFESSISKDVIVIDIQSYYENINNIYQPNIELTKLINFVNKKNKELDLIYIGHNIKFDYKMLKQQLNFTMNYMYCTMIADQRIFKGRTFEPYSSKFTFENMEDSYQDVEDSEESVVITDQINVTKGFSLQATRGRWIKKEYKELDKKIRDTFIGSYPEQYIANLEQVIYAARDVIDLHYIFKCQYLELTRQSTLVEYYDIMITKSTIQVLNLLYWHLSVEQELNRIIGDCELQGMSFDVENWNNIVKYNENKRDKLLESLNNYLKENYSDQKFITDTQHTDKIKQLENRLETLQNRIEKQTTEIQTIELKGNTHTKKYQSLIESQLNNIGLVQNTQTALQFNKSLYKNENIIVNWEAKQQIIEILRQMGMTEEELPKLKDKKKNQLKPSISANAITEWLNNNCVEKYKDFILLYQQYSKIEHALNSFGNTWLQYHVHPITQRVHPEFKINTTDTGRFSGGGGKDTKKIEVTEGKMSSKGFGFNMQQLPREVDNIQSKLKDSKQPYLDYRKSFIAGKNRLKAVMDWSGKPTCHLLS